MSGFINTWLVKVAAGASVIASAGAWWLAMQPLDRAPGSARMAVHATGAKESAGPVTLASFEGALDLDLRGPLTDRPAAAPVVLIPDTPAAPPPPVQVVGTIIEPGHSLVLLAVPGGKIRMKSVGEDADGATITAIDENGITLRWNGTQTRVDVRRAPALPQPGSPPPAVVEDRR